MKNQHDIAYELEKIVENELGYDFDHSGTFFDRDVIHKENFYSVMYFMLHIKGKEGSIDFVNRYHKIKNLNMDYIHDYEAIFDEFKSLLQ